MLVGIGLSCAAALPRTVVSDGIMVAPLGAREHQGQGCEFQLSWKRGASNKCQLLCLLLVLRGLAKFFLPPVSGKKSFLAHEVAADIWDFQSSSLSPEEILGKRSDFRVHFGSTGFSWKIASEWAGSTCGHSISNGLSRQTICYNLIFAMFPSFLHLWTALFIVLTWF